MTIIFDCCHSGSAVELPYVYRPDSAGNINLMDNVKKGMGLVAAASDLMRGGFNVNKIQDAKMLLGGATSFFKGLQHRGEPSNEQGLGEEHFVENWKGEGKDVWMFSGCADDQTSADTSIAGSATGLFKTLVIPVMYAEPCHRRHVVGFHKDHEGKPSTELRQCSPKHTGIIAAEISTNTTAVSWRRIRSQSAGRSK